MLVIRSKGRPQANRVSLPGGAEAMVRPATAFETRLATAQISKMLAGLADAENAADTVAMALGEEFTGADFANSVWVQAAADRLGLLKLAVICTESWSGIGDEEGRPLELNEFNLAIVLRNPGISDAFASAINARLYEERDEKNVSAPSLTGEGGAVDPTAQNVVDQVPPVPRAAP